MPSTQIVAAIAGDELSPQTIAPPTRGPVLPSAAAASRLLSGDVGALGEVLASWVLRASVIGAGMYVAGYRKQTFRMAMAGSTAIEFVVLGWAYFDLKQARKQQALQLQNAQLTMPILAGSSAAPPAAVAGCQCEKPLNARELRRGILVEREHTDNPVRAMQIALDHLVEHPRYYSRLARAGL